MDKFKNILVSKAKIVDYEIDIKRRSNPYIIYIINTYSECDKGSLKKGTLLDNILDGHQRNNSVDVSLGRLSSILTVVSLVWFYK